VSAKFFDRSSQRSRARIGPGKTGQRDAFSWDALGEFSPVCGAEGRHARDARIGHRPAATEQRPAFLTWYWSAQNSRGGRYGHR